MNIILASQTANMHNDKKFIMADFNACTLVPTDFQLHRKMKFKCISFFIFLPRCKNGI